MKKVIKYNIFMLIMIVLTFTFTTNVYAKTCDKDHKEGCYCGDFTGENCQEYDGYGNQCMWDIETAKYCVPKKDKITCEDFHGNKTACENYNGNGTDENGAKCSFNKSTNTCSFANTETAELLDHCIDYNFDSSKECPINGKSRSGETCVKDSNGKGYCRPSDKPRLSCEDFFSNEILCSTDDYSNTCTFNSTNKRCITDYKETNTKTCEELDVKNCYKDDLGDTCAVKDGKCVTTVYQSEINHGFTTAVLNGEDPLLYVYKNYDVELIETDTGFECSDVQFLTSAWMFIRILSPFLIVLFGSLDFFKAMIANDEKKMKEARGKFVKRLIAFLLLIILPFTIQFIFHFVGTHGSENICLIKCVVTNNTSSEGCD